MIRADEANAGGPNCGGGELTMDPEQSYSPTPALASLLRALRKDLSEGNCTALMPLLQTLEAELPPRLLLLLARRDGPALLARQLPKAFPPQSVAKMSKSQQAWEHVAGFYTAQGRHHEALSLYAALYDHVVEAQEQDGTWYHKGMPLVWMSDRYRDMGYTLTSLRYLMLTLVEDAIRDKGRVSADVGGVYWRLVFSGGLSDAELKRFARKIYQFFDQTQPRPGIQSGSCNGLTPAG